MSKTKTVETILVIEDQEKHLKDANAFFADKPVQVLYVQTLEEARKLYDSVDAVITDVFFPESETTLASQDTLQKCDGVLKFKESDRFCEWREGHKILREKFSMTLSFDQYLEENVQECRKEGEKVSELEMYHAYSSWLKGESLAPLGVIVSEEVTQKGIPLVFCTSLYHHGYASQPVHEYVLKKFGDAHRQIDAYPEGGDVQVDEAEHKGWDRAFKVLTEVKEK